MKNVLPIIATLCVLLVLSGCRQVNEITKTEYRYIYQRDSVFRDCTDTIMIERNEDTVKIYEKFTEKQYYYNYFRDTLRMCDTMRIEKNNTIIKENKQRKKGLIWFIIGFFSSIFVIFAVKILKKWYL